MLTQRQRVHASIRRSGFDALPWQFDLTSLAADRLRKYLGVENLHQAIGDHIIMFGDVSPNAPTSTDLPPDCVRSEFGTVWRRAPQDRSTGDWGGMVSYPLHDPTLAGYTFPDATISGRCAHVPDLRRKHPDHFLIASGHGLWEHGWALCGFENYLGYVLSDQAFVEQVTDKLADFSCAATAQLKGMGIDGIRFGDDWGFQDRLMIPPDLWRKIFKPRYRRIFDAARAANLVVMMHSCGHLTEILPDLIDIGLQVLHPLQPEAMDVQYCHHHFGQDLSFWGALGSQSTLAIGTPADCRREAQHRLSLFHSGGYILAPAGAAPTETPPENHAAIVELAQSQLSRAGDPTGGLPPTQPKLIST